MDRGVLEEAVDEARDDPEREIGGFLVGFLFFSWFDRGPGYGTWGDPISR